MEAELARKDCKEELAQISMLLIRGAHTEQVCPSSWTSQRVSKRCSELCDAALHALSCGCIERADVHC